MRQEPVFERPDQEFSELRREVASPNPSGPHPTKQRQLHPCEACGHPCSSLATACPHCGHPLKDRPSAVGRFIGELLTVLFILAFLGWNALMFVLFGSTLLNALAFPVIGMWAAGNIVIATWIWLLRT